MTNFQLKVCRNTLRQIIKECQSVDPEYLAKMDFTLKVIERLCAHYDGQKLRG